ncbi:fibronectin type III domain-containing protein, partial [bacterium]|nr:fibronectin type III domain-containing protein [bacterium]
MRKYLFATALVMACAAFAQNPPRELVATNNLDSRVELAWKSPAPEVTTYEIAYDDGTGGGIDEAGRNDILSVRFTPTERCSLLAIKYFGYCPFPELNVEIGVYEDNGSG